MWPRVTDPASNPLFVINTAFNLRKRIMQHLYKSEYYIILEYSYNTVTTESLLLIHCLHSI